MSPSRFTAKKTDKKYWGRKIHEYGKPIAKTPTSPFNYTSL
jgi:hypothetical protein